MSSLVNKIQSNSTNSTMPRYKNPSFCSIQTPKTNKSEDKSKKKELSTRTKIGIIVGISSVIALGVELIGCKGKHLEKLWEKVSKWIKGVNKGGKKTPEKPNVTGDTTSSIADFTNIEEAKKHFESIGVKTVFKSGSERHMSDLNHIKDDLVLLEKNGVALSKPESIIVSDWNDTEELKQILRPLNINEETAVFCKKASGYWGTVARGIDNKCHVLINSSFGSDYGKFIHEIGHIHQDYLNSSYWHSKGLNNKEFMQKQMEVLGLSDIHLMPIFDTPDEYLSSILRYYDVSGNVTNEVKEKIFRMFPGVSEADFIKIFAIGDRNGKTYYINAKKMVDKMASESGVYAPDKIWENVAEIFQKLNKGEGDKLSDLVMLMYDINGGGRVPNITIKGKKYDDYIESLYNNKDLIRQLRESVEVKELI